MKKNEAYKSFRCMHCVFLDTDSGVCLCGDPESDECPKCGAKMDGNEVQE